MAIRNMRFLGDEVLKKRCKTVEQFDEKLSVLIDDMFDTLYDQDGVGLAAPQIGILRRVVVIVCDDVEYELINPEILEFSGEQDGVEGCLSCPGKWGYVLRPMNVKVKAQNRKGEWYEMEAEDLLARAICHEVDHLDGVLFLAKVSEMYDPEKENGEG